MSSTASSTGSSTVAGCGLSGSTSAATAGFPTWRSRYEDRPRRTSLPGNVPVACAWGVGVLAASDAWVAVPLGRSPALPEHGRWSVPTLWGCSLNVPGRVGSDRRWAARRIGVLARDSERTGAVPHPRLSQLVLHRRSL